MFGFYLSKTVWQEKKEKKKRINSKNVLNTANPLNIEKNDKEAQPDVSKRLQSL